MRRITRLLFFSLLTFIIMVHTAYAESILISQNDIKEGLDFCREFPVSLQVDGETIVSDVPPVIIKGRTLIPARAVFESMGAEVDWNEDARLVEVSLGKANVQLTIDSSIAFVNGKQAAMDVPAMILNDRTLIPVRFVGESLSCAVDWDDLSRTVKLSSPVINEYTEISDITLIDEPEKYRVVIKGNSIIDGVKSFAYNNPERFGIDIKNAQLNIKGSSIDTDNELINSIRFSQFEPGVVRVVIDLEEKIAGKINYSPEKDRLYIDFKKSKADEHQELGDVTKDGLAVIDWRATEKLVVIDPGHGGKDPGSQAIRDGVVILNEKDVNLDVANRLNNMLQEAGVSTFMLREDDTNISLYGRPELANAANAYLYISIHNNYSDNPSANGVETFYYSKANECDYGIYSKDLAKMIQNEMVKSLGLLDRGAKSEPAYAVLNKTAMPAIIIEGAFLSNKDNLELMLTDEFRELYALSVAKSVVQILNESVRD